MRRNGAFFCAYNIEEVARLTEKVSLWYNKLKRKKMKKIFAIVLSSILLFISFTITSTILLV